MKAKSAKNKGNRFENYLIEVLREKLDCKAQRTYGSGSGLDKQDIRLPSFNIEIEAKNQKAIHFMDWWEQCKKQETSGNVGVVAIRNPKKPEFQETMVVMGLFDWIDIVAQSQGKIEVESNFSPKLKWKAKVAKEAINNFMRELEA